MHLVLTIIQEKDKVIIDDEQLKSSRGEEHIDEDDVIIKTSFQPQLLPSRPVNQ